MSILYRSIDMAESVRNDAELHKKSIDIQKSHKTSAVKLDFFFLLVLV